jgi:Fe-S-cluster containining protein
MSDDLAEHRAAIAKIDEAVARAASKAGEAVTCKRGCDQCCVDGLSVLPVEAALIEASGLTAPSHSRAEMCAFLDDDGACSIYSVRPVLCRTHGLALKKNESQLPIIESSCELNYTTRRPRADEALDVDKILALLVTVDRRFRARVGLADDDSRVSLRALATRSS